MKNNHYKINFQTTFWKNYKTSLDPEEEDINSLFLLFQDYYTIGRTLPPLDNQQDWMLLNSSEENGVTTLKFYRERNTTDQGNDTAIPVNT